MNKSLAYKQTTTLLAVKTPLDLLDSTLISGTDILPTVKFFTIQAESQNIRWRDDGTAPTASVGNLLPAGQTMQVMRDRFANFKAIQAAATAIANVTAYDGEGFPFMPAAAGTGAAGANVVTIADGGDTAEGAVADAIVAAGAAGTVSAKLRRVTQGLEDIKTNLATAALADATANPTVPTVGANILAWNGATWDRIRVPNTYKDQSTVAIGTIATVWTPAGGKKFRLMGGSISVSAAGSVLFEDNAAAAFVFRTPKLAADTPYNFDVPGGKLSAAANNVLKATGSTTMNLLGTIWGTEE